MLDLPTEPGAMSLSSGRRDQRSPSHEGVDRNSFVNPLPKAPEHNLRCAVLSAAAIDA